MKKLIPLLLATSYLFCGCGNSAEETTTTEINTETTTEALTSSKKEEFILLDKNIQMLYTTLERIYIRQQSLVETSLKSQDNSSRNLLTFGSYWYADANATDIPKLLNDFSEIYQNKGYSSTVIEFGNALVEYFKSYPDTPDKSALLEKIDTIRKKIYTVRVNFFKENGFSYEESLEILTDSMLQ